MNVSCIRAGVKDLPTGELIAKSVYIEACMTGNPHFPAPMPSLAEIAVVRTELQHWLSEAEGGARAAVATRWVIHAKMERLLVQLSKYVMAQAQGDIDRQVTSGFELRRPPQRITALTAPEQLVAKRSEHEGAVKLAWKRVHGARAYQVFVNAGDAQLEDDWRLVASTTRIRHEVRNLEPGRYHHFRVRALFAAGDGPLSAIVGRRAY